MMINRDFSLLDPNATYTYRDYLQWDFTERIELILGKIFPMSPVPKTQHQHAVTVLLFSLHQQLRESCRVFPAPFDVILTTNTDIKKATTVVQPDITVVCDSKKLRDGGCFGAPDLIVEVISPFTVRRDLHEKLNIYETFGVREYWIVHPKDKTMLIMTPDKDGYYRPSRLMTTGDVIDSRIFPGLKLDLDELFADVVQEPELLYGDNVVRI